MRSTSSGSSSIQRPKRNCGGSLISPKRIRINRDTSKPWEANKRRTSRYFPPSKVTLYHWLADSSPPPASRSEEHTSELQSRGHLVCRLLLEKKKTFV